MDTKKNRIIELLGSVNRPGMDNVIKYLIESDFFVARCNTHHKYVTGLETHSLEVFDNMSTLTDIPRESIIITSLLHDICTAYHYKAKGIKDHGSRSVAILSNICHLELTDEEREAILFHMRPLERFQNRLCRALSLADNISAMFGDNMGANPQTA